MNPVTAITCSQRELDGRVSGWATAGGCGFLLEVAMARNTLAAICGKQLAPISEVRRLLAEIPELTDVNDVVKKIEAARKYDKDTRERQNYWGELAIWAKRELGNRIREGQRQGRLATQGCKTQMSHDGTFSLDEIGLSRNASSRAQKLADVDEDSISEYVAKCTEDESNVVTVAGLLRFATSGGPHVLNNSGNNEWYTPPEIIEAVRDVLRTIDLDPASNEDAQQVVQASVYYTAADDGLSKQWSGNVYMNPPYAASLIGQFVAKLHEHLDVGDVKTAIILVNNGTETKWGQAILGRCSAVCFPAGRVTYWAPDKTSSVPLQGQLIAYYGRAIARFTKRFMSIGAVLLKGTA